MSQTFTDDCFAGNHVGQTDLQNMEDNFAALKSSFSGTSAPANQVPGMAWWDTTNDLMRVRNTADSAWYGMMQGDASQKIWVYRDTAGPGWVVDSSVTDRVLAVKGGTTYTTGGAVAGSWTISGITVDAHSHAAGTLAGPSHNHMWYNSSSNITLNDYTFNSSGTQVDISIDLNKNASRYFLDGYGPSSEQPLSDSYTNNSGTGSVTGSTASDASGTTTTSAATWRPAASVGTLQYLDLT